MHPFFKKEKPHSGTQVEWVGPGQAGLDCSPPLSPMNSVALEVSLGLRTLKTLFLELGQPGLGDKQSERGIDWDTRFSSAWSQPMNLSASGQQTGGRGRGSLRAGEGEGNGSVLRKG